MEREVIKKQLEKCPAYVWCGIILIVMSCVMFGSFLFGKDYFLFPTIVTDMASQIYASYVDVADKFTDGIIQQCFSFNAAWGQSIAVSNPFEILMAAFGGEHVAYMLGAVTVLRLILAGTLFSAFLEIKEMSRFTSVLLGIGYAFSTQVFSIGCWKTQAELAVITALFLLAIEKFKKSRKWMGLVIATILSVLCLGIYYLLTLSVFLLLYIIAEYIITHKNSSRKIPVKRVIMVGSVAVVCLIAGGVFLYFQLSDIFQSARFQSGVSSLGETWGITFTKLNVKIIVTAFLRTLAPAILGIPGINTYYGSEKGWWINDGSYYCGIVVLLVLLNAFGKDKRRKRVFSVALAGCGIAVLCPAVRLIANGFADRDFKLTRMWVTVILLYIAAFSLEEIFKNRENFRLKRVVAVWALVVTSLLLLVNGKMKGKIYEWDYKVVLVFSTLYILLLVAYKKEWLKKNAVKGAMIGITCVEIVMLNYSFVHNSDTIEKEAWRTGYYNDGTTEIIDSIAEKNQFYRVDKSYWSVLLNDARVQGYNGTSYSMGGVGKEAQTEFMRAFSMPIMFDLKGLCGGSYGYPELESFLSVKYIVTKENPNSSYGYEKKNILGGKAIYENRYWLPLAFGYEKAITDADLKKIPPEQRRKYLLDYLVTEEAIDKIHMVSTPEDSIQETPRETVKIENYKMGTLIEAPFNDENSTIVVRVRNAKEAGIQLSWVANGVWENNYKFASIYEENGIAELTLDGQQNVEYIALYELNANKVEVVDELEISVYDTDSYYKKYRKDAAARKENILQIDSYSDEYIRGTIENEENQLLFISIPYDAAFDYYVDGKKVEKLRADYAFTAVSLEKGNHVVEMVYQKSYNKKVIYAMLLCLMALIIKVCQEVYKRHKTKE